MVTRRTFLSGSAVAAVVGVGAEPAVAEARTPAGAGSMRPIDRQAVVARHRVVRGKLDTQSPLQVGNGGFAFGVDVTGLQTFVPFNTMSDWGWHSFPLPPGQEPSDFRGQVWDTHGRPVDYPIPNPDQPELSAWLYANPARLNLGRIGMELTMPDGRAATAGDLTAVHQELDLWTGVLDSRFEIAGEPVHVRTCCHPDHDTIAVQIDSPLVATGRLAVLLDFPYADGQEFAAYVGNYGAPDAHTTTATTRGHDRADITHRLDSTEYHVALAWEGQGAFTALGATTGELAIRTAQYGTDGHWADVTGILAPLVADNSLTLPVNYLNLGDPAPGQAKRLEVGYTYAGQDHDIVVPDGQTLSIGAAADRHRYRLAAGGRTDRLRFTCTYAPTQAGSVPTSSASFAASTRAWRQYWLSGGAIDLSASTDPRWEELERRVVLSQYLMRVNEAGSLPPQEAGLVNNGWNGKFHMEMYWWHGAQWALWNRWPMLDRSLDVYERFHKSARERAEFQGFGGARWPKCTTADGRESPHVIHALLVWQQPHPLFLAEMDYQAHPDESTLHKWRDIVFDTADFLSSWAFWDEATSRYILGPPMYVVSENTDPKTTQNPTFELAYWRFGLRIAQQWRKRLGLRDDPQWQRVHDKLAPLPVQDGVYVLNEGVQDMWTKWNYEHPALIGPYGWLPGDGVDVPTMARTAEKVFTGWQFDQTWGWDFPMLAMCAARLGRPADAVDFLLHPAAGFQFDDAGLATGGPFPYFPSNAALLYAVAFMAAGWHGAPDHHAPGFPADRSWSVRFEGLQPAL
ncbi:DNAJC11 domain-containing protein [Streptomyces sp. NBC_00448]|uniref:DNAJC11 domain-containing protein n=1 Tax=Streptomyces sp. NBC_00448 TaxID=2903652 RepID=UPI002E1CA687